MADKIKIIVTESFVSQSKDELRENVRKVMDEYADLSDNGFNLCGEEQERV